MTASMRSQAMTATSSMVSTTSSGTLQAANSSGTLQAANSSGTRQMRDVIEASPEKKVKAGGLKKAKTPAKGGLPSAAQLPGPAATRKPVKEVRI